MGEATLRLLLEEALATSQHLHLIWQGGEPALMGRGFFAKALELGRELAGPDQSVSHALQTSGTGLDPSWAPILLDGEILVGLSIDGHREVHERWRGPSWQRARDTAAWMLEAGVAVNALSVVVRGEEDSAAERYAALRDLGLAHLQFLPAVDRDPNQPGLAAPTAVDPWAWGGFLLDLWKAWWPERHEVSVRNFDELLASYVAAPPVSCASAERCGCYLVVEHDGSLHRCAFLVDAADPVGVLGQRPLIEVLGSPRQRALGESKAQLPEDCVTCAWRPRCHGGCPYHRHDQTTHLCGSTRRVLDELDPQLRALARSLRGPYQGLRRNEPCPCGSGLRYKRCCATLPTPGR